MNKFKLLFIILTFLYPISSNANYLPIDSIETGKYIYIFAHGLGGDYNQVDAYIKYGIIPSACELFSENGPEIVRGYFATELAQNNDINILKNEIELACQKNGDSCKIILVGVSKGAATVINTVAKLVNENSIYLKNIVGTIIESSPANFNDVIFENFIPKPIKFACPRTISKKAVNVMLHNFILRHYDPYGIQPIDAIKEYWKDLDKNMLVVLVHSKEDKLINISHSNRIYNELKSQGFNNLYFIQAESGRHANVFWGRSNQTVRTKLWCIYKKHGLIDLLYDQCRYNLYFNNVIYMSDDQIANELKELQVG